MSLVRRNFCFLGQLWGLFLARQEKVHQFIGNGWGIEMEMKHGFGSDFILLSLEADCGTEPIFRFS